MHPSLTIDPHASLAAKRAKLRAVEKVIKQKRAYDDLIHLAELMMPDVQDPDDPNKSRYEVKAVHRALADALHKVEKAEIKKLIICMPPRTGKSEMASKQFPAWFVGRDPYRHVMIAGYNESFGRDFGKAVRGTMNSPVYQRVFPHVRLKKGSQAVDRIETEQGGVLAFVGRGGTITGRGADLFIVDDPLKGRKEADSPTMRNDVWNWFTNDVLSRAMSDQARVLVIMTRWHEDDIVGRLTDPNNPFWSAEEAAEWKIINIPAVCETDDPSEDALGRQKDEVIWPERFNLKFLLGFKRRDPRGFMANYQQRPTPMDGELFKADMIATYSSIDEIPKKLRIYAASDHAVKEKQNNDYTVMVVVGVDERDVIWVLDVVWKRMKSDDTVEEMLKLMQKYRDQKRGIITWYMEKNVIEDTLGPFLKTRMKETQTYVYIRGMTGHTADKVGKAQALIGRMSMQMVRFPKFAGWFEKAKLELLKFPRGTHDDFVDALGLVGRSLHFLQHAAAEKEVSTGPRIGSFTWMKNASLKQQALNRRHRYLRGM